MTKVILTFFCLAFYLVPAVKAQYVDTIIVNKSKIENTDSIDEVYVPVYFKIGFFNGKLLPGGQIEINSIKIPFDVRKEKLEMYLKKGDYVLGGYHASGISPSPVPLKIEEGYRYEVDVYLLPAGKPIICNF